jgi:methylmalonyl-CoA/ethylmalonyl-CoA epimerase
VTGERSSIVADSGGTTARSQPASRIRGVDHVAVLVPEIEPALTEFSALFGFELVADEVLADPAVRLVHLDAGNVDIQLVQPLGPGRLADDLSVRGAGLHHLCFGVPDLSDALADLHEPAGASFVGGQGRRACFLASRPSQLNIELIEFAGGAAYGTFAAAASRLLGYWADECRRDLDQTLGHFGANAEVVTPEGSFTGHEAIAGLYRRSFETYPGLAVDVVARFVGRGSHAFEFTAVLTDAEDGRWMVEGVNVITLENGLISRLRSYEDAPRRLPDV